MELSDLILEGNWDAASNFLDDDTIPVNLKRDIINKGCTSSRAGSMLNVAAKLNVPTSLAKKLLDIGDHEILLKVGNSGFSPLHYACTSENANVELIQLLLNVGGKELVMMKGRNGITALHKACSLKVPDPRVVTMLTNIGGADLVRLQNKDGTTALHFMCKRESPSIEVMKILLHVAGDSILFERSNNGKTPFDLACIYAKRNKSVLQWLEEKQMYAASRSTINQGPHRIIRRLSSPFTSTSNIDMNSANQDPRLNERRKSTGTGTYAPTPTSVNQTKFDQDNCESLTFTPTSPSTTRSSISHDNYHMKRRNSTNHVPTTSTSDKMITSGQDDNCHSSQRRSSTTSIQSLPASINKQFHHESDKPSTRLNQLHRSSRLNMYVSSTIPSSSSSSQPAWSPTKPMNATNETAKLKEENMKLLQEKNQLERNAETASLKLQMDLGMQIFDLKVERKELMKQSSQLFHENYKLRHELRSSHEKMKTLESENEILKRKLLAMSFSSSVSLNNIDNDSGKSFLTFPMSSESSSTTQKNPCANTNASSSNVSDVIMDQMHSFHF